MLLPMPVKPGPGKPEMAKNLFPASCPFSFYDALRGILTGLAVGVAVPAQLGDTLGRVAALKSDRRLEAIGAAIISNGIQFYVSVLAGACGWVYLYQQLDIPNTARLAVNSVLSTILFSAPHCCHLENKSIAGHLHVGFF